MLLKTLKAVIDWLTKIYLEYSKTGINLNRAYNHLSPTDEAENIEPYIETLDWALQNREKIKNIAIAGPYGSGKSSVIQTFQNRNTNKEYKFLNISLATFKEELEPDQKKNDDILRLIELSILQQLFYHEKDEKIPDSRFKKIKNLKRWNLVVNVVGILILFLSIVYIFFPEILVQILLLNKPLNQSIWLHFISLSFIVAVIGFILYKLIRVIKGLTISKLSIYNAEIEVDKSISKSILNNHIDEILYFFEVTHYNVVIIEDLDRFKQTEIFTKLREINLIINNSQKIRRDVVFIYAIRDDMFKDKDRTKFFDFMIPIIPVINSSNSNEKLLAIVKNNNYKISSGLLDNISMFIDDMRLLYNIMNEYHLYSQNLNKDLDQNKLLSMVTYKNIYPNDFTDLSNNKGVLFETLNKKQQYIQEKIQILDDEIIEIKNRIDTITSIKFKNVNELRLVYLAKIIEHINRSGRAFRAFYRDFEEVNIEKALADQYFTYIKTNNISHYLSFQTTNHKERYNVNFKDVENSVDPNCTYEERENLITDSLNNTNKQLIEKLEALESQKNEIKKKKLQELISDKKIDIGNGSSKQSKLINILLRNGFIDENYLDYISIFYEGSISKPDYQFLINVKIQTPTDFDYKLHKKAKLVDKIDLYEFDNEYVLNYELVEYLLTTQKHKQKRNRIFNQLKNESEKTIMFIDGFIEITANIDLFIKFLCNNWKNIWGYIENEPSYSEQKKEKYFKLIIEYAEIKDIKVIFKNFISVLSNRTDFLNIINDEEKIKEIVFELDIRFNEIDFNSPKNLLEFIFEGEHYSINPKMLELILRHKNKFDQELFLHKNYSSIILSEQQGLIDYVNNNIDTYVSSVYLSINSNTREDVKRLVKLLNNKDVNLKNREKIIKHTETKVADIFEIEDQSITEILLVQSKMVSSWENIISVFILEENSFWNELVIFINNLENSKQLKTEKIDVKNPDEETAQIFIQKLILENSIELENYSMILDSIPYHYPALDVKSLDYDKAKLLVEKQILKTTSSNFDLLKANFEDLHILLIEKSPSDFINKIDSYAIDNEDIQALLDSRILSVNEKEEIINGIDSIIFNNDIEILTKIGRILVKNINLDIDESLIKMILSESNLSTSEKLRIFIIKIDNYLHTEIDEFLVSLGDQYFKISKKGKRPLLKNININHELAKSLEKKGYISKFDIQKKGIRISTFRK